MEINKYLKDARVQKNITQEDLADAIGVSRQTISSWENGKSYPDIVSIIKLSDFYQISLDTLLKEDKNLIHSMQKNMDSVKSNQSIIFTLVFAILLFGGTYLMRTFANIPKIENLTFNIIMLVVFVIGVICYLFTNMHVIHFLNRKTSNKTIIKTLFVVVAIASLFGLFPLIDLVTSISWQVTIARIGIMGILAGICSIIFHKIDKC